VASISVLGGERRAGNASVLIACLPDRRLLVRVKAALRAQRRMRAIGPELAAQCRAQGAIVFVPPELARHAMAAGLRCEPIPEELLPEELLLSAAHHVGSGSVPALEKSRTSAFGGALDFRAAENVEDPLRCAALLTLGLAGQPCDEQLARPFCRRRRANENREVRYSVGGHHRHSVPQR
jgi:hypothetical protein